MNRKKAAMYTLALVIMMLLFGCQKTPDKSIVVQKNEDTLIAAARQSETAASENIQQYFDQCSPLEIQISNADGNFHVYANTELEIPHVASIPITNVRADKFDIDMLNRIYHLLCADTDMFYSTQLMTKQVISKLILEEKQRVADGYDFDGSIQSYIAALEKQHSEAPDHDIGLPVRDIAFQAYSDGYYTYDVFNTISTLKPQSGKSFSIKTNEVAMSATQSSKTNEMLSFVDFDVFPTANLEIIENVDPRKQTHSFPNLSMSPAEAYLVGQRFLEMLSITNFTVSDVYLMGVKAGNTQEMENEECLYQVSFVRIVEGVPIISPTQASYTGETSESPEWRYEQFFIQLNDRGIFRVFWQAPLRIGDTIVNNCHLLPFSDIEEIFTTMMSVKYEPVVKINSSFIALDIQVEKAVLSLQRIPERDSIGTGLLVPVWNFFGTAIAQHKDGYSVDILSNGTSLRESILSINAIDGSIIDLDKGF